MKKSHSARVKSFLMFRRKRKRQLSRSPKWRAFLKTLWPKYR